MAAASPRERNAHCERASPAMPRTRMALTAGSLPGAEVREMSVRSEGRRVGVGGGFSVPLMGEGAG